MTQTTGGMSLSEIDAKGIEVLELLNEMADAIKLMIPEDFAREDPALSAFSLVGGARVSIKVGMGYLREAVKSMESDD